MKDFLTEIIYIFVSAIITGGGISAFLGVGQKRKNKKLIEDTLTAIDEQQNNELKELKKAISEISADIKDSKFIKLFNTETNKIMHSIIDIKDLQNGELKHALYSGQKKIVEFAEGILLQDFDVSNKFVKEL